MKLACHKQRFRAAYRFYQRRFVKTSLRVVFSAGARTLVEFWGAIKSSQLSNRGPPTWRAGAQGKACLSVALASGGAGRAARRRGLAAPRASSRRGAARGQPRGGGRGSRAPELLVEPRCQSSKEGGVEAA